MRIWILTPHWKTDRWLKVQIPRIESVGLSLDTVLATTPEPYPGIQCYQHEPLSPRPMPNHWLKLDFLFQKALESGAEQSDLILFLDGDALPIGQDFKKRIIHIANTFKYCFIRESSEGKPHCGFFFCRVSDWIGKSWIPGLFKRYTNDNELREQGFDIGGPLSWMVNSADSLPLVKTTSNLHPDFFCTFGTNGKPLVYHHGAGFRKRMISRAEHNAGKKSNKKRNIELSDKVYADLSHGKDVWS